MLITQAFLVGLLQSGILTALILLSLFYNPRIWLHDAPQAMQAAVPPLTKRERRARTLFGIPIFAAFLVPPIASVLHVEAALSGLSFSEAWLHLFIILMTFNLVDLLLIDWGIIVLWNPARFSLAGTEHLRHLNNYAFHFRGFLIGTLLSAIASTIVAGLVVLF